ncbi:hypothetical protein ACTWP5_31615 [Streptomyces sp. 4N509B]|uniref:hypothetical protein n=1 Tax=Streptomyces sp. 4N509B TaxID=3457413 RepID=UPI003FD01646
MPTITVAPYHLSVSANETVAEVMRQFDTDKGAVWLDLLRLLTHHDRAVFVTTTDRVLTRDEVAPGSDVPVDVLEMPWHATTHEAVAALAATHYLSGAPTLLHRDDAHDTYLDIGRVFEAVTVAEPFRATAVVYRHADHPYPHGTGYARAWDFTGAVTVAAGTYVIASTGDFTLTAHSAGHADAEPDVYDFLAREGFGASHVAAGCDSCGGRWQTEHGSWRFHPDRPHGLRWAYDDAEDHADGTIACPVNGCTGRVDFRIS